MPRPRTPDSPLGGASGAWSTRPAPHGWPGPWSWRDTAARDRRGRGNPARPRRRSGWSWRHHAIVEGAHPCGAALVVLEKVLPRRILEALRQARGYGPRHIERVGGPGAEEAQVCGDAAEEAVVLRERLSLVRRQETGTADCRERGHRMRAPDRRMPSAVGHLDSLGDELDIDQSSSPELDVQPPGSLLPELLLHTPAERAHLLEVGRRGLGTVHEGANLPSHGAAEPPLTA